MPFNIDLLKTKPVVVTLQVLKNQLIMYFQGPFAVEMREYWQAYTKSFIEKFPQYLNFNWVPTSDPIHLKLEHTNISELAVMHNHMQFFTEVNPELFSLFLNFIYSQQTQTTAPKYRFFMNQAEVNDLIAKFTEYYKEYKQSGLEQAYEEERKLTPEEQTEYDELVKEETKINEPIMKRYFPSLSFLGNPSELNNIPPDLSLKQEGSDNKRIKYPTQ